MLQIKRAISLHNSIEGNNPITQKQLAVECIDKDVADKTKIGMMHDWTSKGIYTSMRPEFLLAICNRLGVDPNYLYGWEN